MSFLLDTNAVSEICRGRDPHVRAWATEVADVKLHKRFAPGITSPEATR